MNCLLTGSTGFVGRNVLLALLELDLYQTIWLPVRDLSKFRQQLAREGYSKTPDRLRPFECVAPDWDLGPAAGAEHTIHCAAVLFARSRQEYCKTNVDGTLALLKQLRAPQKVVVLSSHAAAGPSAPAAPRLESDAEAPVTWYGQSKLEMEKAIAKHFSHLPYVILRPPLIFGPRDQASLPLFQMAQKPVQFKPGFHTKYYSVLSVEDLVGAILSVLQRPLQPRRVYFVAHPQSVSDHQLLRQVARICERPSRVVSVPQWALKLASRVIDRVPKWRRAVPTLTVDRAKEIWPARWEVSPAAFEKDFEWSAKIPLEDALRRTQQWYTRSGLL